MAVFGHKKIAAVHGAAGCAKAAAAGVLEGFAGAQQGLLTHHAQTFDFLGVPALVLDDPVARDELHRHAACVGDRDGVGESEHILQGVTLLGHVMGKHVNLNSVGRHAHMLTATIRR